MSSLAIIPARSGSRRLPGKNSMRAMPGCLPNSMRAMPGQVSLTEIAAEVGLTSCDQMIISSDDQATCGRYYHHWAERPASLSGPAVDLGDVVSFHVKQRQQVREEFVVILQPTTPVRSAQLVQAMIAGMQMHGAAAALTVTRCVPWTWHQRSTGETTVSWAHPRPYPRSQDVRGLVAQEINAVTIVRREHALAGHRWAFPLLLCVLPEWATLDVDDADDYAAAQRLYVPMVESLRVDRCGWQLVESVNGSTEPPAGRVKSGGES